MQGKSELTGAEVVATDLRAGAALVIAALAAEGETKIGNVEYIDRGYEDLVCKLKSLGADIERI
jgi:UDP-N-acetylglucosamine 1-carboxyvinyltransferase